MSADLSYLGQAFELRVPLGELTVAAVAEALHAEHERLYGFRDLQAPIRLGTARLTVVGPVAALPYRTVEGGGSAPRVSGTRPVFLGGEWADARIYQRAELRAGDRFAGPAVVEQEDTTVVVPAGWAVDVDEFGNLRVRR